MPAKQLEANVRQEPGVAVIDLSSPGPEGLRDRAQILKESGLKRIRLLTNNLTRGVGLRGFRLEISERVPIEVEPNGHNERYLKTKREKLNHVFEKY